MTGVVPDLRGRREGGTGRQGHTEGSTDTQSASFSGWGVDRVVQVTF